MKAYFPYELTDILPMINTVSAYKPTLIHSPGYVVYTDPLTVSNELFTTQWMYSQLTYGCSSSSRKECKRNGIYGLPKWLTVVNVSNYVITS